jgi:hypothetical protein
MTEESKSESVMVLSSDARTELSNVIEESVLAMVEAPASEFLDYFIKENPLLIAEGAYWGFGDTVVREDVCASCSKMLIGRRWPSYGDNWTDEQMETFMKDLKKAHDEWVAKNRK